ncbi:Sec-independent protein translocase protein TatB [Roseateles koreensis]|uniref:Sec-independent protein translocase protein TatB n=1 Tax=Roseateles koreensis TaxID=2987526 RepID=A0ABT5KSG1_9BURK|nr:Sec-independent protein translocase protein TatB [Roseateles koreensis]MDC8785859.1 Sec-independent protein translocase protein TatB [Roseateles koreensis]
MIDFGFDKIALIGAVALVVLGPERLPRVARTVGHLLGKAQRYVSDVKAEVSRSMELEELQKMKKNVEEAARDIGASMQQEVDSVHQVFDQTWTDATSGESGRYGHAYDGNSGSPGYKHPNKKWRIKRAATPRWYKQREGVRQHVQSGAARVARFRPAGRSAAPRRPLA